MILPFFSPLKLYFNHQKLWPPPPPEEPPPPPPPPSPWDELDKLGFPHSEPQPAPKQKDDAQKLREKREQLDELLADDVRSTEEELELFPDERLAEIMKHTQNVQEGIRRAAAVKVALKRGDLLGKLDGDSLGHGFETGDYSWETGLLQGDYHTPWELALQKWFDDAAPRTRNWAHASRRQGDRNDISLPGHAREGWTLHIVLDTSGSMLDDLPRMLGAIEHFARGAHVTQVHLIQVDTEVTADDFIELDSLAHFQALGCGGSDMSPAMQRLADDPTVQHVLVLTDGYVDYPPSVPYDVVWAVPPEYANFEPSYGKVIPIERNIN